MDITTVAIGLLVGMLLLLLLGAPLGVSLGLIAIPFMIIDMGWNRTLYVAGQAIFQGWSSYDLLAIPLFTIMAEVFTVSGLGSELFKVASVWSGGWKGGLAIAVIIADAVFAAMCGSTLAAVALFTGMAMPEMLKKGYSKKLTSGVVCCAGGLAQLIPPSGMAILYAWLVGVSPAKQMMGGLIPGIALAILFLIVVIIWCRIKPGSAPTEPVSTWKQKITSLKLIFIPLIIIIVVLGAMMSGIATAVESAALGCVAAFIVVVVMKRISGAGMNTLVSDTVKTCGLIFFIVAGVSLYSWVLTYHNIPQAAAQLVLSTGWTPLAIVALMQVMYIILGMFLNPNSMIMITVPIVVPIIVALGLDPIWFGVLLLVNIELATITPPVAMALYVVSSMAPKDVSMSDIIKGTIPFMIGGDIVLLILVLLIPGMALWIPHMM